MSPILGLQHSMRRLGRIRMGAKATHENGKTYPKKLETWRMTSVSQELLAAAAAMYGGEVTEWNDSPSGRQWELFTEADAIEVVIPPGDMALSQWFEMWSGGGCVRRCDGHTEVTSGEPCMCPSDPDARNELAGKGEACRPTTRLFVIQPRLPDVGLWHFESHGFYAATEIPGTVNIIQAVTAAGTLVPARLRIEQRTSKRDGKTSVFAVPVIEMPTLTTHTLMTGEIPAPALPPPRNALEGQCSPVPPEVLAEPPASGGTGQPSPWERVIRQAAERADLTAAQLEQLAGDTCGKPFAETVRSEADANQLLAAVRQRAHGIPPRPRGHIGDTSRFVD